MQGSLGVVPLVARCHLRWLTSSPSSPDQISPPTTPTSWLQTLGQDFGVVWVAPCKSHKTSQSSAVLTAATRPQTVAGAGAGAMGKRMPEIRGSPESWEACAIDKPCGVTQWWLAPHCHLGMGRGLLFVVVRWANHILHATPNTTISHKNHRQSGEESVGKSRLEANTVALITGPFFLLPPPFFVTNQAELKTNYLPRPP